MSALDLLLSRLEGVRKSGRGYVARCPAHNDKSPSLSVVETDDGKILVHCFAGCTALSIVQAVGLTLADLFPERLDASTPTQRRAAARAARETQWDAAHGKLSYEATIVLIAAKVIGAGHALDQDASDRLAVAVDRIISAREVLHGR